MRRRLAAWLWPALRPLVAALIEAAVAAQVAEAAKAQAAEQRRRSYLGGGPR